MKKEKDIFQVYQEKAKEYAQSWDVDNQHAIELMCSAMMTRDNVLQGGSFIQAVVRNDLADAVNRADNTAMKYLKQIVAAKNNCYVQRETIHV